MLSILLVLDRFPFSLTGIYILLIDFPYTFIIKVIFIMKVTSIIKVTSFIKVTSILKVTFIIKVSPIIKVALIIANYTNHGRPKWFNLNCLLFRTTPRLAPMHQWFYISWNKLTIMLQLKGKIKSILKTWLLIMDRIE